MKANPKAKRATAKKQYSYPEYRRDWEASHPGFRLRFESKQQLDHIKRAAEATSAASVNEYILSAATKRAALDLNATSVTAPV